MEKKEYIQPYTETIPLGLAQLIAASPHGWSQDGDTPTEVTQEGNDWLNNPEIEDSLDTGGWGDFILPD